MTMKRVGVLLCLTWLAGCQPAPSGPQYAGDSAIARVQNCVCYASVEGQKLKPWELSWDDPAKLRTQISRCTCEADIDVRNVSDPKRYLTPGTVVK